MVVLALLKNKLHCQPKQEQSTVKCYFCPFPTRMFTVGLVFLDAERLLSLAPAAGSKRLNARQAGLKENRSLFHLTTVKSKTI